MAIIAAMPTSVPLHTSITNTQEDETSTNTEVNDETSEEAQGEEEDGQSEIMIPQPPYLGQRFGTFEDGKEYYQRYAMFHVFSVNTKYHRKIKKTNEYNRGEIRCYKARQENVLCLLCRNEREASFSKRDALSG